MALLTQEKKGCKLSKLPKEPVDTANTAIGRHWRKHACT